MEGGVILYDSPQSKSPVKVWHVKEDPQRQTDVNGTQPPGEMHYRKHRGSFHHSLVEAAIRAKCRFVFQICYVNGFILWHLVGTSCLKSSST